MNRLSRSVRREIIESLVEGVGLRSITRKGRKPYLNTVMRLLVIAGETSMLQHDRLVRGVRPTRVETDEIWSYIYCKQSTLAAGRARRPPEGAGDAYTWIALDPDSKLVISWRVAPLDYRSAVDFMGDLKSRLACRIQLTTDGRLNYLSAAREVFGEDIDYAQQVKRYGSGGDEPEGERRYSPARVIRCDRYPVIGDPDPRYITTAHVERLNGTLRESNRRLSRLMHGFSKKRPNFVYHMGLYFLHYNFCRLHSTIKVTPAMEAGLTDTVKDVDWILDLIEENTPPPGPRGPYRPRRMTGHARQAESRRKTRRKTQRGVEDAD